MRLTIRTQGIRPAAPLRQHARRRTYAALSRFGHQVAEVVVSFVDVNGPKGGVDSRCVIHLRGPRIRTLTVRELSIDPYSAADMGLSRMARLVRRRLDRIWDHRHRGRVHDSPRGAAVPGHRRSALVSWRIPADCHTHAGEPVRPDKSPGHGG